MQAAHQGAECQLLLVEYHEQVTRMSDKKLFLLEVTILADEMDVISDSEDELAAPGLPFR